MWRVESRRSWSVSTPASRRRSGLGNRTQRVDQQGTHSYGYDNLYRLTSVTYPGPATTSYVYDAFGNRTSMTVGSATTSYSYDDNDRITAVTPPSPASAVSYTWDDNGNLTNRGSDSFAWDYEDRMTSATVNGVSTSFAYRGDGLRNSRTSGGVTTTFTWDVNAGLPVVLDDGSQYVYGAGLTGMKQGGSWYYYLADGLGSTMAIVDSTGAVPKSYTYDVYGKATATGTLSNEFDFAGQQTDGTGLQYLRARYMDPATGTFTSREPLGVAPGWTGSGTAYGGGSPTNLVDPSGWSADPPDWKCQSVQDDSGPVFGCPFTGVPPGCGTGWTGPCVDLIGEYIKNTIAGCKVDPALCSLVIGSQATTALIGFVVTGAVTGACVETAGGACVVASLGFRGLHFITFKFLNDSLGKKLREKGKEARGK